MSASTSATGPWPRPRPREADGLPSQSANEAPKRPRRHVGKPKAEDRVPVEPSVANGWNRDYRREQNHGGEIPQTKRRGGQVPERGPHGEGRDHRRPVEALPPNRIDLVKRQGPLGSIPGEEYGHQQHRVENGRGAVRHPETHVQHIGAHRSKHAHRANGQPVGPGDIAPDPKLQRQGSYKPAESEQHGDYRIDRMHTPVRCRLSHRR